MTNRLPEDGPPEEAGTVDWEAVYHDQMPRLYNFFRYRTGDNETAQDLTAATLMRAWRFRDRYRDDLGAFEAWLFAIARNIAIDHLRSRGPVRVSLDSVYHLASRQSVEREVIQRRQFARLMALLETYPPRVQEIVALKFGAEMTNRAIASALNMGESNVGTILHRTLKKLRIEMEAHDEERW